MPGAVMGMKIPRRTRAGGEKDSQRAFSKRLCNNGACPMSSERFHFGVFEFDTATGQLQRNGTPVALQAQPAQVLGCLLERAGQAVSREDLRQAVWGAGTFVDFDRGLNFCISQIRSALRDDSAQPLYIRTIPKHGYQFIAPVERRVPNRKYQMAGVLGLIAVCVV